MCLLIAMANLKPRSRPGRLPDSFLYRGAFLLTAIRSAPTRAFIETSVIFSVAVGGGCQLEQLVADNNQPNPSRLVPCPPSVEESFRVLLIHNRYRSATRFVPFFNIFANTPLTRRSRRGSERVHGSRRAPSSKAPSADVLGTGKGSSKPHGSSLQLPCCNVMKSRVDSDCRYRGPRNSESGVHSGGYRTQGCTRKNSTLR